MSSIAYIDAANLQMATRTAVEPWRIDMARFRFYLLRKYDIETAYYFIGAYDQTKRWLYDSLVEKGFDVVFKQHDISAASKKKGNVDVELSFSMMRDLRDRFDGYDKAYLISGDGDYRCVVDYLIDNDKFGKVLLPSRRNASSLYKKLGNHYRVFLEDDKSKFGKMVR